MTKLIGLILFVIFIISSQSQAQDLEVAGKAKIGTMDPDNQSNNFVVRQNDGTLATRNTLPTPNYFIGQLIGTNGEDGVVFWVDHTGEHGLICSKDDLIDDVDHNIYWYNGMYPQTNGVSDYDGADNTDKILMAQNTGDNFAAKICKEYSTPGTQAGDWHLPAIDELNKIFQAKYQINRALSTNSFSQQWYWSSTEYTILYGLTLNFGTAAISFYSKSDQLLVRAVRPF